MPSATAEGVPPSAHAQDHPDQHDDTVIRDLQLQVEKLQEQAEKQDEQSKRQSALLQDQVDKVLLLEQLLTGQHMERDTDITDSRENSVVVCARDFGSAQGGVAFVAPGQSPPWSWPSPVTASVQPGPMISPMAPVLAFHGYGAFPSQGTGNIGTEGRPQTTAVAAAGVKARRGPPRDFSLWSGGARGRSDQEREKFVRESLSKGVMSCLLGPGIPNVSGTGSELGPGQTDALDLILEMDEAQGHPDITEEFVDTCFSSVMDEGSHFELFPVRSDAKDAYAEFVGSDKILACWALEVEDIDIYQLVALRWPQRRVDKFRTSLWVSQVFLCMLLQMVVPPLVAIHTMMQIVTTEDTVIQDQSVVVTESIEWDNVCRGRMEWDPANLLTKVVGSILLLYMFNYLVAKQGLWKQNFDWDLLVQGSMCPFPPGDSGKWSCFSPAWLGTGLVLNGFSLVWSGLVSIVIIYAADSAVDIVLNALALFFIADIDNDIVSPDGKEFAADKLADSLDVYRQIFKWLREGGEY